MNIDTNTQLCAVIGHPVRHSLSPLIHNSAFRTLGLNYVYLAFDVVDVENCLRGMRALDGFRGLSVTIPHKENVTKFLDEIDPVARRIGSVNTIINEKGRLIGTNTDGEGTIRAFERAGVKLQGKRVLFLGAGGAVRAVAFTIASEASPQKITILGRNPDRLRRLVSDLKTNFPYLNIEYGYLSEDFSTLVKTHEVIIQGTPVGMEGHSTEALNFPYDNLDSTHAVLDMVYKPLETRLIKEARKRGSVAIVGTEMLIEQAGIQFELWTGCKPPLDKMRKAVESAITTSNFNNREN
ncbi:MAG: shikimate dehydrogenase [Candidatus Hydrogenedentes bacterium]|nr:shikimate dehydrogenase [Candidatus Hydrogenedentota bacterium]